MKIIIIAFISLLLLSSCENRGNAITTFIVDDQGTYGAAISNDGKYLLTGSISGFGRVWDVKKQKVLFSVQNEDNDNGGIIAAEFSGDDKILVVLEQQALSRWDAKNGKLKGYWSWPDARALAISDDGRFALIGLKSNQAIYFDMVQGKMVYVFPHHQKITSVAIAKNGKYALTGADDWHASLWDLSNKGKHVWSKNMKYKISNVSISDDGKYAFANAYVGSSKIFSTDKKGKLIAELPEHKMTVASADFSDRNSIIATGRASRGIDLWDVKTGKHIDHWEPELKQAVQPDAAAILDIKLLKKNRQLATLSSIGIFQLWDLKK